MAPRTNRLFDSLSPATRERLRPYVELVHLTKGRVLYPMGDLVRYAWFPTGGMISLLAVTEDGETLEVATIGNEGVAGLPMVLQGHSSPYQVTVQMSCDAYRVNAEAFVREFKRGDDLQQAVLQYLHTVLCQLAQSAVCHRFHSLTQRLCCWLLLSRDRVGSDTIELTQEFIAHMLGLSRPRISIAAALLEDKGFIRQRHGRVQILNPKGLQAWSCECYRVTKQERTI